MNASQKLFIGNLLFRKLVHSGQYGTLSTLERSAMLGTLCELEIITPQETLKLSSFNNKDWPSIKTVEEYIKEAEKYNREKV